MKLGKVLLIANPVAKNGKGVFAASYAERELEKKLDKENVDLRLTEGSKHGFRLAAAAGAYDTVLAVGGDGLVHEVVNGLMTIPEVDRPTFGLLPAGSGNDYARTLGMSFDIKESLNELFMATPRYYDLGRCDEEFFVQSLSFGLDAAIALDTLERRKQTGKTGTPLFLESGIDVLLHRMKQYSYRISLDDWPPVEDHMLLFAIQIGETYGGGFRICPQALPDDGWFDICVARPPLGVPKALMIFLLAKNAHHTEFKQLEFTKAHSIEICFGDEEPPTQADGEELHGSKHTITCLRRAIEVLVAPSAE